MHHGHKKTKPSAFYHSVINPQLDSVIFGRVIEETVVVCWYYHICYLHVV